MKSTQIIKAEEKTNSGNHKLLSLVFISSKIVEKAHPFNKASRSQQKFTKNL